MIAVKANKKQQRWHKTYAIFVASYYINTKSSAAVLH